MKPTRFQICVVVALIVGSSGYLPADEADYRFAPAGIEADTVGATTASSKMLSPAREHPLRTVASSLAIVLGGFIVLTALFRKFERPRTKPSELMETLGAVQVTPKVKLHLVRLGKRVLVLHLGSNSVERVAEINDPAEVEQLLGRGDTESVSTDVPQVDEMLRAVGESGVIVR